MLSLLLSRFRKDRTLVEILNSLRRLEAKIDQIPAQADTSSTVSKSSQLSTVRQDSTAHGIHSMPSSPLQNSASSATNASQDNWENPKAHKILTWPIMQEFMPQLFPSDFGSINDYKRDGAAFLIHLSHSSTPLTIENTLQTLPCTEMVGITTHILFSSSVSGLY